MPFQHDVRSVTVPGWVDGLLALHERFGSLRLAGLLAPAQRLATAGFPVSTTLAHASAELDPRDRAAAFGDPAPLVAGRPTGSGRCSCRRSAIRCGAPRRTRRATSRWRAPG